MTAFLKAEHWQLFLVLMGSYFLSAGLVSAIPNEAGIKSVLFMLPVLIYGLLYCGWLWTVASSCARKLPPGLSSSPRLMGYGLIYMLIYFALFGLVFSFSSSLLGAVMLLHFLCVVAQFYAFGFTAKQLTKLEQGQDVGFAAYSMTFFLIWFFPVGVWFLQPRVNQLLGDEGP